MTSELVENTTSRRVAKTVVMGTSLTDHVANALRYGSSIIGVDLAQAESEAIYLNELNRLLHWETHHRRKANKVRSSRSRRKHRQQADLYHQMIKEHKLLKVLGLHDEQKE